MFSWGAGGLTHPDQSRRYDPRPPTLPDGLEVGRVCFLCDLLDFIAIWHCAQTPAVEAVLGIVRIRQVPVAVYSPLGSPRVPNDQIPRLVVVSNGDNGVSAKTRVVRTRRRNISSIGAEEAVHQLKAE